MYNYDTAALIVDVANMHQDLLHTEADPGNKDAEAIAKRLSWADNKETFLEFVAGELAKQYALGYAHGLNNSSETFDNYLEEVSQKLVEWPEWKRNLLSEALPDERLED